MWRAMPGKRRSGLDAADHFCSRAGFVGYRRSRRRGSEDEARLRRPDLIEKVRQIGRDRVKTRFMRRPDVL
jgi:hypothetical protein